MKKSAMTALALLLAGCAHTYNMPDLERLFFAEENWKIFLPITLLSLYILGHGKFILAETTANPPAARNETTAIKSKVYETFLCNIHTGS